MGKIFKMKGSLSDHVFDVVNVIIMIVLLVIFIWPLWFVAIASISDPNLIYLGKVILLPKGITLEAYKKMMDYTEIWMGYANTTLYTVVGTLLNMVFSVCVAYPLSNKQFMPRNILMVFFMITMYFGGGLIPTYLVVRATGLLNTRWVMVISGLVSFYNCLIIRSYFMNSIPSELKEAAILDGANEFQHLTKVVLPLAKPVLAVVGLYYMVGHWNDYLTSLYYIYDNDLRPLQSVLRELLMSSKILDDMKADPETMIMARKQADLLKYCVIIAASLPMLCVYPFIQKYFVKGVMVGAIKG